MPSYSVDEQPAPSLSLLGAVLLALPLHRKGCSRLKLWQTYWLVLCNAGAEGRGMGDDRGVRAAG